MQFIARLAGNSHCARFNRVLKLAMATALPNHVPTISRKDTKDLANLHSMNPY